MTQNAPEVPVEQDVLYSHIAAVVFGGVFDGLHCGHLALIGHAQDIARALDVPCIGLLNSNDSLLRIRRSAQHSQEQRARIIRAVAANDTTVEFFDEPVPTSYLDRLARRLEGFVIFVKGSDAATIGNGEVHAPVETTAKNVVMRYVPVAVGDAGSKLKTRGADD